LSDTTEAFRRIPSDAGVTFEGFETLKIPSREAVRAKLEDFIQIGRSSSKPTIRILLGEWGEGKTDAFRRYLKPTLTSQGDYAFLVSASTISNAYGLPKVNALLQTSSNSAVRFLVALFHSIGEEGRVEEINAVGATKDAYEYLDAVLDSLLKGRKKRRIFVFVDEFEELLTNKQRLDEIISGIKEVINGLYPEINEGGKHEGLLHFVIAATPDAYYQLQIKEDTALIFGGLGRRGGAIELPAIRKVEGLQFLFELLRYSYEGKLPEPLPFRSFGIFHAIYRIAQGNPGNMVSLFTRVMSSATKAGSKMRIIDYESFLKFIQKEQVSIYGGTAPCLEAEAFARMLAALSDQRNSELAEKSTHLFRLMIGEPKAFDLAELESRLGGGNLHNTINATNEQLRLKEGIPRGILKLFPLRRDKSIKDVLEVLGDFVKFDREKKSVKIGNYAEPIEAFEDRLTYYTLESTGPSVRLLLPGDPQSASYFFEGIDEDRANEVTSLFRRRLCEEKEVYSLSDQLLDQIYPAPVPRELEFLTDRGLRLKLWRDVTKNLSQLFESVMPQAFISINRKAGIFESQNIGVVLRLRNAEFHDVKFHDFPIKVLFAAFNGDLTGNDVEAVHTAVKSANTPVQLVVLVYTGEKTAQADDKISTKSLGRDGENLVLEFHVHPTLAKRIISIYQAQGEYSDEINNELLLSTTQRVASQDIGLAKKLDEWLVMQQKSGKVIKDFVLNSTTNIPLFGQTLRFFTDTLDTPDGLTEIFRRNLLIQSFFAYESKVGLAPDIEFPEFSRITDDLVENGFVSIEGTKYKIRYHPVETQILKLLGKHQKLTQEEIASYFITKNPRLLTDVFLPALQDKGMIVKTTSSFLLSNRADAVARAEQLFQSFHRLCEIPKYQEYGYVFMTKERGWRLITLSGFKEFADNLHLQVAREDLPDEQVLNKVSLLDKLLNHFLQEFVPLFDSSRDEADSTYLVTSLKHKFNEKLSKLAEHSLKWLRMKIGQFEEMAKTNDTFQEVERARKMNEDNVRSSVETSLKENPGFAKTFAYRNDEEAAYYFNPKLYFVKQSVDKFTNEIENHNKVLDQLFQIFGSFDSNQGRIDELLAAKKVPEYATLSKTILRILRSYNDDMLSDVREIERRTVTLRELLDNLSSSKSNIEASLDTIKTCIALLDDLLDSEKRLNDARTEASAISSHALEIFDTDKSKGMAISFGDTLASALREIEVSGSGIKVRDLSAMPQTIKSLRQQADNSTQRILAAIPSLDEVWQSYRAAFYDFVSTVEIVLALIQKRHSLQVDDLKARLESMKAEAKPTRVAEVSTKLSVLEASQKEISDSFYDRVKPVLSKPKEVRVLELIVSKTRRINTEWLAFTVLLETCQSDLGIPREEAEALVRDLIDQGLIKQGISLSV
jgi:hypothetical protein